jgi:beta-glucuronidase
VTREAHAQAIRELVARDRHHPSVVVWSIANEPETTSTASRDYFAPLLDLTRELDPTRPVGIVNMFLAPPDRCQVTELCDLTMVNRYFGWYVHHGDLAAAEAALEAELRGWAELGKPVVVTEYGADALPGRHGALAEPWTEEYQAAVLEMSHRVFDRVAAVVGEHVWTFADFATVPGVTRVDGNTKGIFTRDRRPKAAAQVLRTRWLAAQEPRSSSTATATS